MEKLFSSSHSLTLYISVFILNTVLYKFLRENVFNFHELRLLVIISFLLMCVILICDGWVTMSREIKC